MERYAIVRLLDAKPIVWPDLAERYLASARGLRKASTIRCSEIPAIKTFSEFVKDQEVTHKLAADWAADLFMRFKSPHTIKHKIAVIRGVFKYALRNREIAENPLEGIEEPKTRSAGRLLTRSELRLLFDALPLDIRRVCIFGLHTGMRRGEVLNMEWSWVHHGAVEIPASFAKSGRSRTVPLHRKALAAMGETKENCRVFDVQEWRLNDVLTATWRRLSLGRVRFHDLRHTAATRFMEKNHDLFALMKIFGWASPSSAMIYQHMTAKRVSGMLALDFGV